MAKIGRNDPCPCGSGKKHKRCCLIAQTPIPDPASTAMTSAAPVEEHDDLCDCCLDALNERADRTLDLLLDGHVEEAEAMAHDLMRDFPGEVEGIDLLSMVSEARGERERAVDLLRRAIDIVRVHPFHDAETRVLMHQRLSELEQRA
jgi:SEC-C motif